MSEEQQQDERPFRETRRQQYLTEEGYKELVESHKNTMRLLYENFSEPEGENIGWHCNTYDSIAYILFQSMLLEYTAGKPITPLRSYLEQVVIAYETYATKLREHEDDPDAMAFPIRSFDGYPNYLWLISLCFLLHRRDLIPRVAKLVDGETQANAGADWIIEEFLSYDSPDRFDTDTVIASKPYSKLADALEDPGANPNVINHLHNFLKAWYKDMGAAPWWGSHEGNRFTGYWTFEAAAAVLLLEIKDDSSLHQYIYYPKDLLAWSRANIALSEADDKGQTRLRVVAGEACLKDGYYFTPAAKDSRKKFKAGEVMPVVNPNYGVNIWQWDDKQS